MSTSLRRLEARVGFEPTMAVLQTADLSRLSTAPGTLAGT